MSLPNPRLGACSLRCRTGNCGPLKCAGLANMTVADLGGSFTLQGAGPDALDAERYRYLRNIAGQWAGDEDGPMVCDGLGDLFEFLRGEEVDASVDQAIAAYKAAGSPEPIRAGADVAGDLPPLNHVTGSDK